MKEILDRSLQSMNCAAADIQSAHSSAISQGDQFAQIILLELLGDARKLSQRLAQALDAANASNEELTRLRASNAASRALHEEKQERAIPALDKAIGGKAAQA